MLLSVILCCLSPTLFLSVSYFSGFPFQFVRSPRVFFKMHLTHFVIVRKFEMSLQLSTFTTLWLSTDMCCTHVATLEVGGVGGVGNGAMSCSSLISSRPSKVQAKGALRLPACCSQVKLGVYVICTFILYKEKYIYILLIYIYLHMSQSQPL